MTKCNFVLQDLSLLISVVTLMIQNVFFFVVVVFFFVCLFVSFSGSGGGGGWRLFFISTFKPIMFSYLVVCIL